MLGPPPVDIRDLKKLLLRVRRTLGPYCGLELVTSVLHIIGDILDNWKGDTSSPPKK